MAANPAAELVDTYLEPVRRHFVPGTQDVAFNEPGFVMVRNRGVWTRHEVPQCNLFWLENLCTNAGSLRQQNVGLNDPILDTEICDATIRFNSVLFPHVDIGRIGITMRQHETEVAPADDIPLRYQTDGWNQPQASKVTPARSRLLDLYRGADTAARLVEFLKACVRSRLTILIVGPTGAGKTTLLNTLAREIPPQRRIVTLEDSKEIKLPLHLNKLQLLYSRNADSRVGPLELARAVLRMHPDVAIIGELRGPEAWTCINDIVPPHPGSLITTHGNTADSGYMRVFGMCRANPDTAAMDDRTLARMIANVIDVIAPLYEVPAEDLEPGQPPFKFQPLWFIGEALDRGRNATELMWEN